MELHGPPTTAAAAPTTTVKFVVKCETVKGEYVAVVGSAVEVGQWDVGRAALLHTSPTDYPRWTLSMNIRCGSFFEYKYVVVRRDRGKLTLSRWESQIGNRSLLASGVKIVADDGVLDEPIASGSRVEDGSRYVSSGWIGDRCQLRIELGSRDYSHGKKSPVEMLSHSSSSRSRSSESRSPENVEYRARLVPFTKKYTRRGINPIREGAEVVYSAPELSDLSVTLNVWEYRPGKKKTWIGRCFVMAEEWSVHGELHGVLSRPILSESLEVIGKILINFNIVTPFLHPRNNLNNVHEVDWNPVKLIGHRGFGSSAESPVEENTLLSFQTAHKFGLRYVEFDVQVTADGVPVIHHDFEVHLNHTTSPIITTPVRNLTLSQFMSISSRAEVELGPHYKHVSGASSPHLPTLSTRLSRTTSVTNGMGRSSHSKDDFDSLDLHPRSAHFSKKDAHLRWKIADSSFATLETLFKSLSPDVGFNIELKYPYKDIVKRTNYLERNAYVDTVLQVVFDNAFNRPIFFSSFDPDLCVVVAKKQPRYPVFLLTEAKGFSEGVRTYDYRCVSVKYAADFAASSGLRGIVSDVASLFLEMEVIEQLHLASLLIFTYGKENNYPELVDKQKRAGVDAIIADKVTKVSSASAVPVSELVSRQLAVARQKARKPKRASPSHIQHLQVPGGKGPHKHSSNSQSRSRNRNSTRKSSQKTTSEAEGGAGEKRSRGRTRGREGRHFLSRSQSPGMSRNGYRSHVKSALSEH
eukprot:TRINITY_DN1464_c0_g1_i1.p1 TRINITY_DN1464_c0_g1~~TRINITY_DN1464_c0_g1_i1.p1  ORF type:complete len:751 (-),score=144.78 TRINITY_DN1464_c0_g1_i1:18-2270(-)